MTLKLGADPITDLQLTDDAGAVTPVRAVYLGPTIVWDRWPIYDPFNVLGWLSKWIDELCNDPGGLLHDPIGYIVDGLGNIVGYTVSFVQGGINQAGTLVSTASTPLVDAYCGMWGQSAPPNGLIGLVNGIPIIGGAIADWLTGSINIESILGSIPVLGDFARMIGVLPDAVSGAIAPAVNYVTDALGQVIGAVSCGAYTSVGGLAEPICYALRIFEQGVRMGIPDGLIALPPQISRYRYGNAIAAADNGPLEALVTGLGDGGYATQVFRRYANSGSGLNGVGFQLVNSALSIIRRVGGVDTIVAEAGAFTVGDLLHLDQVGDTHTLLRNGAQVAQWIDAGATAATGAANRSVGLIMQGAKDLTGPRRFSPTLGFVRAA